MCLLPQQLLMAVIIFSSQREDRYNAVKKVACAELGLPTQCIIARTISQEKKLRSVTVKIALQINCKLGGELWSLKIPMSGLMVSWFQQLHTDPFMLLAARASFTFLSVLMHRIIVFVVDVSVHAGWSIAFR